jgi:serine/threonine protein kinase
VNSTPTKPKEEIPISLASIPEEKRQPLNRATTVYLQKALSELDYVQVNPNSWIHSSDLEFTKKLGSGTSGKVYQGLYKGKEVAIKVLKDMTAEEQLVEFKKEFQMMSAIKSAQVVLFYGACLEPKLSMVMELCQKGSLYNVLQDKSLYIDW